MQHLSFLISGPSICYKRQLSPAVQPNFQHKIRRGFLKLGPTSPVPCLFFLLGELPIEATLHCNLLALFYNIWVNPPTKIFEMVSYIMKMAYDKSTTWSYHVRLICKKYSLPDPLKLNKRGKPW